MISSFLQYNHVFVCVYAIYSKLSFNSHDQRYHCQELFSILRDFEVFESDLNTHYVHAPNFQRNFKKRYQNGIRSKDELLENISLSTEFCIPKHLVPKAQKLNDQYIASGSVDEVNVPGQMGIKINGMLKSKIVFGIVFDCVIEEGIFEPFCIDFIITSNLHLYHFY